MFFAPSSSSASTSPWSSSGQQGRITRRREQVVISPSEATRRQECFQQPPQHHYSEQFYQQPPVRHQQYDQQHQDCKRIVQGALQQMQQGFPLDETVVEDRRQHQHPGQQKTRISTNYHPQNAFCPSELDARQSLQYQSHEQYVHDHRYRPYARDEGYSQDGRQGHHRQHLEQPSRRHHELQHRHELRQWHEQLPLDDWYFHEQRRREEEARARANVMASSALQFDKRGPPSTSGPRPGSPSRARPGSPSRPRPGSQSRARPGSPSRARPGSLSRARPGSPSRARPGNHWGNQDAQPKTRVPEKEIGTRSRPAYDEDDSDFDEEESEFAEPWGRDEVSEDRYIRGIMTKQPRAPTPPRARPQSRPPTPPRAASMPTQGEIGATTGPSARPRPATPPRARPSYAEESEWDKSQRASSRGPYPPEYYTGPCPSMRSTRSSRRIKWRDGKLEDVALFEKAEPPIKLATAAGSPRGNAGSEPSDAAAKSRSGSPLRRLKSVERDGVSVEQKSGASITSVAHAHGSSMTISILRADRMANDAKTMWGKLSVSRILGLRKRGDPNNRGQFKANTVVGKNTLSNSGNWRTIEVTNMLWMHHTGYIGSTLTASLLPRSMQKFHGTR